MIGIYKFIENGSEQNYNNQGVHASDSKMLEQQIQPHNFEGRILGKNSKTVDGLAILS